MNRVSLVTVKMQGFGQKLVPIRGSSALAAWAYDSTTQIFEVMFHSGRVKAYILPVETVQEFVKVKSKGGFYNREIKGKFRGFPRVPGLTPSGLKNTA